MKRFLINIVIFFGIIIVVDKMTGFGGSYLQAHVKGGRPEKTNSLLLGDEHDVIVFGSSRASHHYDTPYMSDALGLDCFNAGFDGNGIILAYGLFEMITERYNPKLVIYEVTQNFDIALYSGDQKNVRYLDRLKPYYKNEAVGNIIKEVSEEEWYKVQSGLVRYNSKIISLAFDNLHATHFDKGYEPTTGSLSPDYTIDEPSPLDFYVDTLKLKYVRKFIALAKEKNIPVVFVKSPRFGELSSANVQAVKEICEEMNVPFLDYKTDESFQRTDYFSDRSHLT